MIGGSSAHRTWGDRLAVLVPYLWLVLFFLLPFLIVFRISLSQTAIAQPPYTPLLDLAGGLDDLREFIGGLSFDNYATLASDTLYLASYVKSLEVAAIATTLLLVIGYPI